MLGICPDLTARHCKQLCWTPAWCKFHLQTNTSVLTLSLLNFHASLQEKHTFTDRNNSVCYWFYEPWPEGAGSSASNAAGRHCLAAGIFAGMLARMLTGMLQPPLAFSSHVHTAQHFVYRQHWDTWALQVVQASEWKIKQVNNTELLDMTAELCNLRTAMLN